MPDELNPAAVASVTATLSHIAGILDILPLASYEEQLRQQRDAVSDLVDNGAGPVAEATLQRIFALRNASRAATELIGEIHRAHGHFLAARAAEAEDGPGDSEYRAAVLRPNFVQAGNDPA